MPLETKKSRFFYSEKRLLDLCAHLGSNQGPKDYESSTLTDWAIGAVFVIKKENDNSGFDDAIIDIWDEKTKFLYAKY